MKTKIFFAFIVVILAALLSNFIFEWLIIKDFDNYVSGVREDQFYWILSSVEGSYADGRWDKEALSESIHWAMMLGLDIRVLDANGREVISSMDTMNTLSPTMMSRMERLFHIHTAQGSFSEYPLSMKGNRIGILLSRPFPKEEITKKEAVFKQRTKNFLYVSFLIAGCGSLLIALLFSQYLSRPITDLKKAAEKIANGDFGVRIRPKSEDEVGKLSESFNAMAGSLQKEEQLRKRLMSNIAHELRTPLAIMKAHVEAMADGIIEDREKGIENISGEIDRLIKLVKGIEDVTVAEASFFSRGESIEVNLYEFLSGLAGDMSASFREKGLGIEVEKRGDLPVVTDSEKLEKVVRNILSNALKYTDNGGVRIEYGRTDDMFFIEIRDSGRGIPENELPLIFTRFYRAGNANDEGIGLGLAIVKELVDVMGGKITTESEVGQGTAFRVQLPMDRGPFRS